MWREWRSISRAGASGDAVTALKSMALNAVMLAVTIGVLYWALQGEQMEPAPKTTAAIAAPVPTPSARPEAVDTESAPDDVVLPGSKPSPSTATAAIPGTRAGKPAPPARRPVVFPINVNTAKAEDF